MEDRRREKEKSKYENRRPNEWDGSEEVKENVNQTKKSET